MFFKMEHCDVYYGQIQALYDINVEINPGEIISIIGANGAGKTTLMKSIMGLVPAKNGKIVWQDEEIQARKTHHIVKRGISYVPEGREIFPGMTVLENMEMGAYTLHMSAKEKADKLNEMYELFPRLYERKKQKAGTLSGGEQQMVAIARGLMLSPKLLMMDEPSLGLAPIIVDEVFDIISRVNEKANIPVLLVEQNAYMALSISHRSYVLENGVIVDEGESKKLLASAQLNSLALTGMCHASLPYMHAGSSIINMGSNSAWQPVPYQAVYGASKSYVLSLSRALGRELRPQGIHVMCVCPGWIKTEFQQVAHHDEYIRYVDKWYGPDEVAAQAMQDLKKKKSVSILGHPVRRQVRLVKLLPVDTVMDIWCKQQGIE